MDTGGEKSCKAALIGTLILISLALAVPSFGQTFRLKVVAQVGDVIDGKTLVSLPVSYVALNDRGEVGFLASFTNPDGSFGSGLFTQDRLIVEAGQTLHGKTLTALGGPVLNNNGDIAFFASFPGGQGIFTLSDLIVETGQVIDGKEIQGFISGPVLNDLGEVLFHARIGVGVPNPSALFNQSGLLAQTGVAIDGRTPVNIVAGVGFDDAGDVIFVDVVPFTFPSDRALMTPDAVLLQTGTVIGGRPVTDFRAPSLNNNRQVVFVGGSDIFSYDIPTRTGKLLFQIGSAVGGEEVAIASSPQLNERGDLAFTALFDDRVSRGVIASDEVVIKSGDSLDGRVVSSPGGLVSQNNKGEVAFVAFYTSINDRALVLATQDSDGDGIPDDEDACEDTDLGETVIVEGCDTGVTNELFGDGCSLADIIADIIEACTEGAKNKGQAVSCITHDTNELKKAGILSGEDKGAIQSCLP